MKKQFVAVLALSMLLAGCGQSQPQRPQTSGTPATSTTNETGKDAGPKVKNSDTGKFHAVFSLSNDKPTVRAGEEIEVVLRVSNLEKPVSTVTAYLMFNKDVLNAESVDFSDSAFPVVFRNKVDNESGMVEMSSSSRTGVTGDQSYFAKVKFKAKQAGTSDILFNAEKLAVLLEDNTDVKPETTDLPKLSVTVQ